MVKIRPLLTKLWLCKVNHHFVKQFSPLCTGFRTYVKTARIHIISRRFFVHKEKRTTLFITNKKGIAQQWFSWQKRRDIRIVVLGEPHG